MPERLPTRAGERLAARLWRALESERGSFLIEIVVSAALIGVVTISVFAAFDGANAASGRNKAKTVANSLAEQDQERLRAMPIRALGNVNETNTKKVGGVDYTVVSRGQWITESTGGSVSCTSGTKADYVKISTTVSWPNMRLSKPIQQDSIVSPPPGNGVLGILAKKRDGATPLEGLPVSVTGPETVNATTDANGCAFIGSLAAGSYTIAASLPGYTTTGWSVASSDGITPTNTAISDTFTPTTGGTTVKTYLYDKAATINVSFDTKLSDGTIQTEQADQVTFENTGYPLTGFVTLGKQGTQRTTYSPNNVFPFPSAYSVYSGDCPGANPLKFSAPGQTVQANPAGAYNITAREPAMNILVMSGALLVPGGTVKVTPDATAMSGCTNTYTFTTVSSGTRKGQLPDPAMPYGVWSVCADDGALGSRKIVTTVTNDKADGLPTAAGVPTTVLNTVGGTSITGSC